MRGAIIEGCVDIPYVDSPSTRATHYDAHVKVHPRCSQIGTSQAECNRLDPNPVIGLSAASLSSEHTAVHSLHRTDRMRRLKKLIVETRYERLNTQEHVTSFRSGLLF